MDRLEWPDGLFDIAWSEEHENHVVSVSGDGSVQLWDFGIESRGPLMIFREHAKEVYRYRTLCIPAHFRLYYFCFQIPKRANISLLIDFSVDWAQVRGDRFFVTGSWDHTAKVWDPTVAASVRTFGEHVGLVYCTVWSPHDSGVFASASGDGTVRVWDCRRPVSVQTIGGHDGEVLSCDWNKYEKGVLVTAGVDRYIRGKCFFSHEFVLRPIST